MACCSVGSFPRGSFAWESRKPLGTRLLLKHHRRRPKESGYHRKLHLGSIGCERGGWDAGQALTSQRTGGGDDVLWLRAVLGRRGFEWRRDRETTELERWWQQLREPCASALEHDGFGGAPWSSCQRLGRKA